MSKVARTKVTMKTSGGLNTWTFTAGKDFRMKVFERGDGLYQAEGRADGVGERLSDAVISAREKVLEDAIRNGLAEDPRMVLELDRMGQIADYLKTEIGS